MSAALRIHTAQSAAPALRAESLDVYYGGKRALKEVSLEIPARQITALIGPSGCGKTSFLSTLNRLAELVPSCRVSGKVWVGERDVYAPDVELGELRRRVGMIFQKPNPFPLSIRRNIELPLLEQRRVPRAERDAIVEDVLTRVGLWKEVRDRLDRSALALSGGQQQRLCLARALALEPQVLLLDEPCSALDPLSSATVEDLVASLRDRCTIVIVTHNLAQARRIADYVALFWVVEGTGVVVEHGPVEQLFGAPRHELTAAYVRGARG